MNRKGEPVPVVWIPSLLRELTNGQKSLVVPGATVREVIDNLESRCPGIKARLCDGDRLRPSITVMVDGATSSLRLRQRLEASSEVHFVIAISGGMMASVQAELPRRPASGDQAGL